MSKLLSYWQLYLKTGWSRVPCVWFPSGAQVFTWSLVYSQNRTHTFAQYHSCFSKHPKYVLFILVLYGQLLLFFNTALLPTVATYQSPTPKECYCPVMFLWKLVLLSLCRAGIYTLMKLAVKYLKLVMKDSRIHLISMDQLQDFTACSTGDLITFLVHNNNRCPPPSL